MTLTESCSLKVAVWKLHTESGSLKVAVWKLHSENCSLKATVWSCILKVAAWKLQSECCNLTAAVWKLQSEGCSLQVAACKLHSEVAVATLIMKHAPLAPPPQRPQVRVVYRLVIIRIKSHYAVQGTDLLLLGSDPTMQYKVQPCYY